jgi:hypothetical protein
MRETVTSETSIHCENSYLTFDPAAGGGMDDLVGRSITYRVAIGPGAGQKVFTLQTVPVQPHEEARKGVAQEHREKKRRVMRLLVRAARCGTARAERPVDGDSGSRAPAPGGDATVFRRLAQKFAHARSPHAATPSRCRSDDGAGEEQEAVWIRGAATATAVHAKRTASAAAQSRLVADDAQECAR